MTNGLVGSLLLPPHWRSASPPLGWVGVLALAATLAAGMPSRGVGDELKQETGRLAELIARLASRDYVLGEPSRDGRPYADPSKVLNAFRHVASAMAWGDVRAAARQAAKLDYEVVEFTDAETKKPYLVLREDLGAVETIRGWGSYILNPHSRVDALVEAPHPLADAHTPEIGGQVFAECEAKGFLLAGAHREKADVPDLVDSVFHQVHAAWIGPLAQVTAWQIHGFASGKHAFPRGAQVVTSTGDGEIAPEVAALDTVLEERGLTSYVFNELPADAAENRELNGDIPGVTFSSLAGAKNEQGRLSRSLGGSFVHIELDAEVRTDGASRKLAGSAIAAVINESAARTAARGERRATLVSLRTSEPIEPTPARHAAATLEAATAREAETAATAADERPERVAAVP